MDWEDDSFPTNKTTYLLLFVFFRLCSLLFVYLYKTFSSHKKPLVPIMSLYWRPICMWFFSSYLEFLNVYLVRFYPYFTIPYMNRCEKSISYPLETNHLHLMMLIRNTNKKHSLTVVLCHLARGCHLIQSNFTHEEIKF